MKEVLLYDGMVQAPYPPLLDPPENNLVAMSKATSKENTRTPSLMAFVPSRQHGAFRVLPEAVLYPEAAHLQTCVEEGILVHTGPPWPMQALDHAISNGPHASACSP